MAKRTATKTATCRRCRATLRASAAAGIGPRCARIERAEAAAAQARHEANVTRAVAQIDVTAFKDPATARAKAEQLILDSAIVPTRHTGQYLAASSDGAQTYLVDTIERSCTCKAGARLGRCSHLVAADATDHLTSGRPALTPAA